MTIYTILFVIIYYPFVFGLAVITTSVNLEKDLDTDRVQNIIKMEQYIGQENGHMMTFLANIIFAKIGFV